METNKKGGAPKGNRNAVKPDPLKSVTIRLLPSQLTKLKAIAATNKTTYNELIRQWIDTI